MRYGVTFAFDDIFFTHFHADHFLGVIGLVRTLGLQGRTEPLRLVGPRGAKKLLGEALSLGVERQAFAVDVTEVEPGQAEQRDGYELRVFDVEHGGGAMGMRWWSTSGWAASIRSGRARWGCRRGRCGGAPPRGGGPARRRARGDGGDDRGAAPAGAEAGVLGGHSAVRVDGERGARRRPAGARGDLLGGRAGPRQGDGALHGEGGGEVAGRRRAEALVLTHLSARYSRDSAVLVDEARAVFPRPWSRRTDSKSTSRSRTLRVEVMQVRG